MGVRFRIRKSVTGTRIEPKVVAEGHLLLVFLPGKVASEALATSMVLSLPEEIPLPKTETLPTSKMKRLVVEKTRLRTSLRTRLRISLRMRLRTSLRTRLRMRMSLRLQTAQTEATVARAEATVPQPATVPQQATVLQQATLLWGGMVNAWVERTRGRHQDPTLHPLATGILLEEAEDPGICVIHSEEHHEHIGVLRHHAGLVEWE